MNRSRAILLIALGCAVLLGAGVTIALQGDLETFVFYGLVGAAAGAVVTAVALASDNRRSVWIAAALAAVWGIWVLIASSAGGSLFGYIAYFAGGLAFVLFSAITLVVLLIRGVRPRTTWWRVVPLPFSIPLLVLGFTFVAMRTDSVSQARFALSRPALEAAAAEVRSGAHPSPPGWIGLYRVRETDKVDGAVRFIVGDSGLDDFGLVYSPSGRPPAIGEDTYEHIDGPWWSWVRSW